jgi:hypothetical protein
MRLAFMALFLRHTAHARSTSLSQAQANVGYRRGHLLADRHGLRKAICGEKDRKMFDERGLYLLVRASGSKLWRMKYRYAVKEKSVTGKVCGCNPRQIGTACLPVAQPIADSQYHAARCPGDDPQDREARAHDAAHRVRNHVSEVFVWSIASGPGRDGSGGDHSARPSFQLIHG